MLTRITNQEKIGRALDCLLRGLQPFIDSRLRPEDKASWQIRSVRGTRWNSTDFDVKDCLEILNKFWDDRFKSPKLDRGERAWVNELIDKVRNRSAHRTSTDDVPDDDAGRALDTAERLLAAIGSPEAENVRALRLSLRDEPTAQIQHEALPPLLRPADSGTAQPGRHESGRSSIFESLYVPDLLGGLTIVGSSRGLRSVRLGAGENRPGSMVSNAESQLREYLDGRRTSFDLAWDLQGTSSFQRQVWHVLAEIPYGETRSYGDIARAVNKPKGAQAVGQANSRNPLLLVIPCHRVTNADGSLGGWGPGEDKKQQLLDMERRYSGRSRKL
jgi:methylated-DNA-[protein]-cysteine S-methyltransferase